MIVDTIPSIYSRFYPIYLSLEDTDNAFYAWKYILISDELSFSIINQNRTVNHPYTYSVLYGVMIMGLYNE